VTRLSDSFGRRTRWPSFRISRRPPPRRSSADGRRSASPTSSSAPTPPTCSLRSSPSSPDVRRHCRCPAWTARTGAPRTKPGGGHVRLAGRALWPQNLTDDIRGRRRKDQHAAVGISAVLFLVPDQLQCQFCFSTRSDPGWTPLWLGFQSSAHCSPTFPIGYPAIHPAARAHVIM
jgi:hypothetical protein